MEAQTDQPNQADIAALQHALVEELKQRGVIRWASVEAAFRSVPRHLFLPNVPLDQVYQDQHIPIKYEHGISISASSQPTIMAIMLEQLALAAGQRVLEIGAGTGYNAALIAHIVGATGQVVTLDVDEDLVVQARRNLTAAGFEHVTVVQGDGAVGYPSGAPYDRIILTVGAWDILPAWHDQLAPDGRLVLPLTLLPGLQLSIAFEAYGDYLHSISARPCGFMPLRGPFAHPRPLEWEQAQVRIYPHAMPQSPTDYRIETAKEWNHITITWPSRGEQHE